MTVESPWIKVFAPRPEAALRLVCFPYAGGGASIYRLWPAELRADVEVLAVQLPGREGRWRESAFRSMEPLVAAVTEALGAHLDRPSAFFGHSMGAAIAFEVARRLGERQPLHLFVSGRPGPRAERESEPIHGLARAEFIEAIRGYSGTPDEVLANDELMELIEPLLRADFAVSETYDYRPGPAPLDVPITALGGTDDRDVPAEKLALWGAETRAGFRMQMFEGGHFFLTERRSEVLAAVARDLEAILVAAVR